MKINHIVNVSVVLKAKNFVYVLNFLPFSSFLVRKQYVHIYLNVYNIVDVSKLLFGAVT